MIQSPVVESSMEGGQAKEKLQRALTLLHKIYSVVDDITIVEDENAGPSLRKIIDIYRKEGGRRALTEIAKDDIPF